jgi:hypothetical protein
MRFVPTAVVVSTLSLICPYTPASGLDDSPLPSPRLRPRRIKPSPETDAFSMPNSSGRCRSF